MISNPALAVPDVGINGLINLLEGVLDWRLTLSAMPRAGAPMKAWPQIAVSLRGRLQPQADNRRCRVLELVGGACDQSAV
jgi:hypothetical protein